MTQVVWCFGIWPLEMLSYVCKHPVQMLGLEIQTTLSGGIKHIYVAALAHIWHMTREETPIQHNPVVPYDILIFS